MGNGKVYSVVNDRVTWLMRMSCKISDGIASRKDMQ